MKKYILLVLVVVLSKAGFAQYDSTLLYLRFPTVPVFKLINVADSTTFTKDNLKKKKPVIIMMFSPDCEHCQAETKELTANIKLFKNVQIVMASPLDFNYLRKFYDEYKIADYANITMGRDPSYMLGTFYKVRSFPAIFVYDKKGNFVTSFSGSAPIKEVAAAAK